MVCSVGVFSKVSSRVGHPSELVKLIPSALASYIPKALLVFGEEKPNVQDLNNKPWTRDQVRGWAPPCLLWGHESPKPPWTWSSFPWKSSALAFQAAMFFADVVKAEPDFSR